MFLKSILRRVLCAFVLVLLCAACVSAAEGARSAVAARQQSQSQSAANLGAGNTGGRGSDLAALARQKPQQATTFTGFPAGTLPDVGSSGGTGVQAVPGNVVLIGGGDPLLPVIGTDLVGTRLERICVIADHAGYRLTQQRYVTGVLDTAYIYSLMNGNRKLATLYFDHSMTLRFVR